MNDALILDGSALSSGNNLNVTTTTDNDSLVGGAGDDIIYGGADSDSYLAGGAGEDEITELLRTKIRNST